MNHLFAFVVLCTCRVHPGVALIVTCWKTTPWILKVRRIHFKACLMWPVNTRVKSIINKCSSKRRASFFLSNYLSGNIFRLPKLRSASVLLRSKPIYRPSFSHEGFKWAKTCVREQSKYYSFMPKCHLPYGFTCHAKCVFCVRVRREKKRQWRGEGCEAKILQSRFVPLLINDCSQKMVADMR